MSVKILLADDSPTVHKVIKIILKDESYEIVECAQEEKLLGMLLSQQPQLVFLDFNFSEKHSGYELAAQIKKNNPQAKLLIMYGTFDTVDEGQLRAVGIEQFVVKPFDTAKFKIQVRGLVDGISSDYPSEISVDDSWTIKEERTSMAPPPAARSFEDDLGDWGMSIPGVIGEGAGSIELPPVIEASPAQPAPAAVAAPAKSMPAPESKPAPQTVALPQESDLEYPDMSSSSLELEPMAKTSSKLISLDDLALDVSEPLDSGVLLELAQMDDSEIIQKLEEQIRDEVEADLWSVDSIEEASPRLSVVKEAEEEKIDFSSFASSRETMDGGQSFDENIFARIDENETLNSYNPTTKRESKANPSAAAQPMNLDDLRPMIKELINQAVADYCRQHIDKVAWEVIPDLAENLIKQELKKISDKVSRDL